MTSYFTVVVIFELSLTICTMFAVENTRIDVEDLNLDLLK